MPPALFRVFELVNFDASEIVVGVAPVATAPDRLARAASRPDWQETQRVSFRVIEDSLTLEQAARLALSYSESDALKAFAVFLGPDLTESSDPAAR
jgi:hypothetical protein